MRGLGNPEAGKNELLNLRDSHHFEMLTDGGGKPPFPTYETF